MTQTLSEIVEQVGTRTEAEVREVRRARLIADLRVEGASEQAIERLATDKTVDRLLEHERRVNEAVLAFFGPDAEWFEAKASSSVAA